jgi:hypothetical protein
MKSPGSLIPMESLDKLKARSLPQAHHRPWSVQSTEARGPMPSPSGRHVGTYAFTNEIAPWAKEAFARFQPSPETTAFVKPFAAELHTVMERERANSTGLHDLDAVELIFQFTLEISAAIMLAADKTDENANLAIKLHTSMAGRDDHFAPWGKLLTGLDCDPPIIVQFPFYLFMCQAFTSEPAASKEDYVYSTLMGADWVSSLCDVCCLGTFFR